MELNMDKEQLLSVADWFSQKESKMIADEVKFEKL